MSDGQKLRGRRRRKQQQHHTFNFVHFPYDELCVYAKIEREIERGGPWPELAVRFDLRDFFFLKIVAGSGS